jgi:hypothetical protein
MVILALGFTSLLLVAPSGPAHAEELGQWTSTTSYPADISSQSCVAPGSYIYCVGDQSEAGAPGSTVTDYAPISSAGGLGSWTSTSTPLSSSQLPLSSPQCVSWEGYIYCLSGSSAIFAPLSSSGVGAWTSTTSLPTVTVTTPQGNFTGTTQVDSCVVYGGYIYCTTAVSSFAGNRPAAPVYSASLSSSGIGAWTATTSYPLAVQYLSCAASDGYIYCVGGQLIQFDGETVIPNIASVYFAQVLPSGALGAWTSTTSYPTIISNQSCAIAGGGVLYCVDGLASTGSATPGNGDKNSVYFAQLGAQGGLSSGWVASTDYPVAQTGVSCVGTPAATSAGYLFCIGGSAGSTSVYYSSISSQPPPPTSQLTVETVGVSGSAFSGYYTLLYDSSGALVATGFSPATFTVDTGQTYVVAVDDYGACHFLAWDAGQQSPGSPFASYGSSNSTTLAIAGDVSVAATFAPADSAANSTQPLCGSTTSTVLIDSVDQTGQTIPGYYTALSDSNGTVVGTGFTTTFFSTTVGQSYSLRADSYGSCTFTKWSDGVTSDPRTFVGTIGGSTFTVVYDCAAPEM